MKPDPTLDDIRKIRHEISESVNHDAKKLVEYYRKLQEKHPNRVVTSSADKLETEIKDAA